MTATRRKRIDPKIPPSEMKARIKRRHRDYLHRFWSIVTAYYALVGVFVVVGTVMLLRRPDAPIAFDKIPLWLTVGQGAVFYVLPIVLALAFAWSRRPMFWTALRQMFIVLVAPLALFSLAGLWLYGFEQNLIRAALSRAGETKFALLKATIKPGDHEHRLLELVVHVKDWRPRTAYFFHAFYSQYGWPLPDDTVGSAVWMPSDDSEEDRRDEGGQHPAASNGFAPVQKEKTLRLIADIGDERVEPFLKRGAVDVDVVVVAYAMRPAPKTWLSMWWLWMPFFKPVTRKGDDGRLKRMKVLRTWHAAVQIPARWVLRNAHAVRVVRVRDEGDRFKNGRRRRRFVIEAQSLFNTAAVARIAFWGLPYDVHRIVSLKKGNNEIIFDVAGGHFDDYGVEPPFYIGRLTLTNDDPLCRPDCPPPGSVPFTVHTVPGLVPAPEQSPPRS